MRHLVLLGTLALSVATVVSACGDSDTGTAVPATPMSAASAVAASEPESAAFNDADVTFAQEMIPHHRQASEMAALAPGRAETPEVLDLADAIRATQEPEIETMTGWLVAWGEAVPEDMSGMEGMDHGGTAMDDMAGMMSAEEMTALEGATGPDFDQMFLTMMIEHHEGAIEMAEAQQQDGENADAVALAATIAADQSREIQEMQDLLGGE